MKLKNGSMSLYRYGGDEALCLVKNEKTQLINLVLG